MLVGVTQVGFGHVAWLSVGPGAPGVVVAGAGQALRLGETGQVPEIEVSNPGDAAVLVPAHLVLTGGWQTRAVERSAVVPAHSVARVAVKCVEAGRWAPRDEKTARSFEIDRRTSQLVAGPGFWAYDETGEIKLDDAEGSLKKRVLRRITTLAGGFAHLPRYGVPPMLGTIARGDDQIGRSFSSEPPHIPALCCSRT